MAAFVLEHGRLWSVGVRGYAMIPDGLPLDEGVIGRAVRTSAAQLVLDVSEDPDFVEVSRATVSEFVGPALDADRGGRRPQYRDERGAPRGQCDARLPSCSQYWPSPWTSCAGLAQTSRRSRASSST